MTITDALAALNTAGQTASKMDAELAGATERLGVRDLSSAQTRVSAAHTLLAEQGRNLAAIEKVLLALAPAAPVKPPEAPAQPTESIVAWAKRVHPEVDIGTGYQLHIFSLSHTEKSFAEIWKEYVVQQVSLKPPGTPQKPHPVDSGQTSPIVTPTGCQIEDYPFGTLRLPGLFMKSPNVAVKFRTPNYVSTSLGKAISYEYIGEPQNKQASISDLPCDFSVAPGAVNLDGPASTTLIWFTVGIAINGRMRLEPDRDYYYNLRIVDWTPAAAREQFAVGVHMPPGTPQEPLP